MTTSPFILAGAAALLLAASAAGQEPRLETRLDPATYRGVVAVIEQARARGLPTEPLVDKALEGVAKRAPGERIIGAVARLSERLGAARAALGPNASLAEVQAGAEALAVGVPEEALRELRATAPDASLAVPLGVLTQLVSRGIAVSRATETVLELLRRGARPPQLIALGQAVQEDIAQGMAPATALDVRLRGVLGALPSVSDDVRTTAGNRPPR
ncbi:MAG TPA: hypothetical protein VF192_05170 [Longimicrobiales bacterium]